MPDGYGYRVLRSCSWCDILNDERSERCGECGHDAQVPRMRCRCEACRMDRLRAVIAEDDAEAVRDPAYRPWEGR